MSHLRVPVQVSRRGWVSRVLAIAVLLWVSASALAQPQIQATPDELAVTLPENSTGVEALTVSNSGDEPLEWQIDTDGPHLAVFSAAIVTVAEWDDGDGPALYAGGTFATVDGASFRGMARWDGETWSPLGTGMSGTTTINSLIVYDGALIAGGNFTQANDQPAFRVARWDGSTWSPVGTGSLAEGMNGAVNALAIYNGELIAAGAFTSAGGQTVNRIARWNGTQWQPLDQGVNSTVAALAIYDGDLIAAGNFAQASGQLVNRVARWNGSSWSALGFGVDGNVLRMTAAGGELIVSGLMNNAGGTPVNGIARWDGNAWSALGQGVDGLIRSMTEFEGDLIAGGRFLEAGGMPVNNIARWDGDTWSALGAGITPPAFGLSVEALGLWQGSLVAGGNFQLAGHTPVNNITLWDGQTWRAVVDTSVLDCGLPTWASADPTDGIIASGAGEAVDVTFDSAGVAAGTYQANLCLTSNDPLDPQVVVPLELTAEGPPPAPQMVFEPASLNFGNVVVGASAVQSAVLHNQGNDDAEGLVFNDVSSAGYTVDADDCDTTLPPGAHCEVVITFSPPGPAPFNPMLVASISGHPPGLLALTGTGVEPQPPVLEISPASLTAVLVEDAMVSQTLMVANAGDLALDWELTEVDCALPAWVGATPAGGTVPGGADQAVSVTFNAAGLQPGSYEADLCISSNDPDQSVVAVPLDLTVEPADPPVPQIAFSPATLSFGNVTVGSSAMLSATLHNTGDGDAEGLSFSDVSSAGYSVDGSDCGSTLAAGTDCAVVITFAPPGEGTFNPMLVASIAGHGPGLLQLTGAGIAPVPVHFEVDPESLSVELWQGTVENHFLNMSNSGDNAVSWFIPDDVSEFGRPVSSLAAWDDGSGPALYVGGEASGEFNGIARWDGEIWLPLGTGVGPLSAQNVRVLTVHDNALIAGGTFHQANGITVNRIARWDGVAWTPLGEGVNGPVDSLTVYNGDLIAGGNFTEAGGVAASRIARWDGHQWSPLGSGLPSSAASLAVYDGQLIAGGNFTSAGGVAVNRIAAWDGSEWSPLGQGLEGAAVGALELIVYNGDLIAGGGFSEAGGQPASRVARWNGSQWSALGDGIGGQVQSLAVYNGDLIVGGIVSSAGGTPVNAIARWDGSAWSTLGNGLVNSPGSAVTRAVAVVGDDLFVGGNFISAGFTQAYRIARWDGADWHALVADPAICDIPDWVQINPTAGSVAAGESEAASITLDARGLAPGVHEATLCVVNNDPGAGLILVPVEMIITEPPVADVSPGSFTFDVEAGATADGQLNVGNLGPVSLDWEIGGSDPQIVVFENINFTVPSNPTGGSVRWNTGDTCNCDEAPFNFNMWRTNQEGQLAFFWPAGGVSASAGGVSDGGSQYSVLAPGAIVGPQSFFIDNIAPAGTGNWRQSGGVDGYLGFRFFNPDTESVNYGYARIRTTGLGGHPATIVGWAYNQSGGPITVAPLAAEGCDNPADVPWLNVTPTLGSTPPGGNVAVDVMVDSTGLDAGDYDANLCMVTNDPAALLVEVPVSLNVLGDPPPQIEVTPGSLSSDLFTGESETQNLTIANQGVEALTWQVAGNAGRAGPPHEPGAASVARMASLTRDMASILGRPLPGLQPVDGILGIVDCDAEPGIIIHDDGTVENAYGVDPAQVNEMTVVDRFTPSTYPATFTALCVALTTNGPSSLSFDIVIYDDDGPGGSPGTELGALAVIADGIPAGSATPAWFSYDIASLDLLIESGSVFIGVRYAPSTPNVFVAADESPGNPVGFAGGYITVDVDDDWYPLQALTPDYRSLFVRAVEASAEGPPDCTLPAWLSVEPGSGTVAGGGQQSVDVTFDAAGLAPGEFEANLCIASNDPVNALLVVPVTLTVQQTLEDQIFHDRFHAVVDPGGK